MIYPVLLLKQLSPNLCLYLIFSCFRRLYLCFFLLFSIELLCIPKSLSTLQPLNTLFYINILKTFAVNYRRKGIFLTKLMIQIKTLKLKNGFLKQIIFYSPSRYFDDSDIQFEIADLHFCIYF